MSLVVELVKHCLIEPTELYIQSESIQSFIARVKACKSNTHRYHVLPFNRIHIHGLGSRCFRGS